MRAPPHTEVASRGLRQTRGRSPWYGRWWVWTLLVLAVLLALLLGHRMHASNGNDGILYDLFSESEEVVLRRPSEGLG